MNARVFLLFVVVVVMCTHSVSAEWSSNSSIVAGLVDVGIGSAPTVFNDSGELWLISGERYGTFVGYKRVGSTWVSNSSIVAGLVDMGTTSTPTVFNDSGELWLISGNAHGAFVGYKRVGSTWVSNSSIVAGLVDVGMTSTPTVFNDSGELWLISGEWYGTFVGYKRVGSTWVSNSSIVAGLVDVGYFSTPTVFNGSGELWLISGNAYGTFVGYKRVGSTWVSNSPIVAGLVDIGYDSTPAAFYDSGEQWLISGKETGHFLGYIFNYIPSVPTIISPSYNEYFTTHPVVLNVSSTDAEGDTLTYYFYGDTVDGTTLINISTTGAYSWDVASGAPHYWKVRAYDGHAYSDNTSLQVFSVLFPPDLLTPTNTSTTTFPFPPLLHVMVLTWENVGASSYKYQVSNDVNFNLIDAENTITTNYTTASLEAGDYYWRVYAYNESADAFGDASDVWQFTINETKLSDGTAIDGVVYNVLEGGSAVINDALVNIWNDTWSGSMIVGQNGYFFFGGLGNSTYYLKATKNGYTESVVEIVTTVLDETSTRNILLQSTSGSGIEYEVPTVKFTVTTLWYEKFAGVAVKVYLGDAVVATYTEVTGTDGSVAFELDKAQEYRLTFIDASQGINEVIILYPVESSYNVYVYDTLLPDDEPIESEDITVSITTSEIDDDNAYINVTYLDDLAETTALTIYINQSNKSDPANQTTITFANLGGTSSITHSFMVSDYSGQAYFVNVVATHTTFGDVHRTYSVRFDGMADDRGFSRIWIYMGVAGMMFIGGLFKSSKAEQGALITCIAGWIFITLGWFDALGSTMLFSTKAGLGLATIIALMANMAKKDRDETI